MDAGLLREALFALQATADFMTEAHLPGCTPKATRYVLSRPNKSTNSSPVAIWIARPFDLPDGRQLTMAVRTDVETAHVSLSGVVELTSLSESTTAIDLWTSATREIGSPGELLPALISMASAIAAEAAALLRAGLPVDLR